MTDHQLDVGGEIDDLLNNDSYYECECGQAVWIEREQTVTGDEGGGRWFVRVHVPAGDNRMWTMPNVRRVHAPIMALENGYLTRISGCTCGFVCGAQRHGQHPPYSALGIRERDSDDEWAIHAAEVSAVEGGT